MNRRAVLVPAACAALALLLAACPSDGNSPGASQGSTASSVPPTAITFPTLTTVGGPTTTAKPSAATAVIEPDTVAGIALGANKSAAIAVLGNPTVTGQSTDLSGATYDYLRWDIANRALTLNFRTPSATSPLLTDWQVTAAGPATKLGIKVGDTASQVVASYGLLQNFCCDSKVASVERGGGRLIVVVDNASQTVRQLIGGDPAFWSRSIAS